MINTSLHLGLHNFTTMISTLLSVLPTLILSIALGQAFSICYEWSYEGLSFSRRFINGLSLITLCSAALMLAISAHLALGLGLLGSMAMIRFRVNTRDLWEMSFVFAALVAGLCCGIKLFAIAIAFTACFCALAITLIKGQVGAQFRFDGVLRFWLPYVLNDEVQSDLTDHPSRSPQLALESLLKTYSASYQLISMREGSQGEGAEMSYHITLRGRRRSGERERHRAALFNELKAQFGVEELSLLSQDHHLEL